MFENARETSRTDIETDGVTFCQTLGTGVHASLVQKRPFAAMRFFATIIQRHRAKSGPKLQAR